MCIGFNGEEALDVANGFSRRKTGAVEVVDEVLQVV
jgi:hypothetical protein